MNPESIVITGAKLGDFVFTPLGYGWIDSFEHGWHSPEWVLVTLSDPGPGQETHIKRFPVGEVRRVNSSSEPK